MNQFLEAGEIVNTHGTDGEVKINPWCDSAEFLASIKTLYIKEQPVKVLSARVHKSCVLVTLDKINTLESAMALKGKIVYINRNDVKLPKGSVFIQDLIGLEVFDARFNRVIGKIKDVRNFPSSDIYIIESISGNEILIPAVPEFVENIDMKNHTIFIRSIEGMCEEFED